MSNLTNARFIKSLLIDYLLGNNENIIIGSELMFSSKQVVSDMFSISDNRISAFEIKAKNDDLRKLANQLEEYNKVFQYVYIVVTENHLKKARLISPLINGIIVIKDDNSLLHIRKARLNRHLEKREIISTMTIQFLKSYFKIPVITKSADVRIIVSKYSYEKLLFALGTFLTKKTSKKFSTFLSERGTVTHLEDVVLLSSLNKRIVP